MRKYIFVFMILALAFGCAKNEQKKNDWFADNLNGRVKKVEENYYGAFGSEQKPERGAFSFKVTISYSENGFRNQDSDKTICHYNAAGLKDTITNLDSSGTMQTKFVNEFDSAGNITQTRMFDQHANPVFIWAYRYDDERHLLEEMIYDALGSPITHNRFLYQYDTQGNWIQKVVISAAERHPLQIIERTILYY